MTILCSRDQDAIKVEAVQLEKCPSPEEHNDSKRSSPAAAVPPVTLKNKSISPRVLPSTSPKERRRSCHFVPIISLRSYENAQLLSQLEKIFEDGVFATASKRKIMEFRYAPSQKFDSYKDAQFALKPLEDFLMIEENYEVCSPSGRSSARHKLNSAQSFCQKQPPI